MPDIPLVWPSLHVRATVTDQGAMLLDLRGRGTWHALPPSGALWWRHLADGASATAAADRVAEHFGVDRARVRADIADLVADMLRLRLVTPAHPARRRWWWPW